MRYEAWVSKHLQVRSRFGDEVLVLCPFHDNQNSPSCSINLTKGLFICYSCGEKGHLSSMARRVGASLTAEFSPEAVSAGISRLRASEAKVEATQRFPEAWLDRFNWKRPHKYWTETRKFTPETCQNFKLGYDSFSNAGTIPIRDVGGNVLGVIRRRLGKIGEGEPRYLYPKGFKISWHLFGSYLLQDVHYDRVAVTEGSLDAIAMWEAGIPAVALLGARLHPHQLTILTSIDTDKIILCLDNDQAGKHASATIAAQLVAEGFDVMVSKPVKGKKDPASMTRLERRISVQQAESYLRLRLRAASA